MNPPGIRAAAIHESLQRVGLGASDMHATVDMLRRFVSLPDRIMRRRREALHG